MRQPTLTTKKLLHLHEKHHSPHFEKAANAWGKSLGEEDASWGWSDSFLGGYDAAMQLPLNKAAPQLLKALAGLLEPTNLSAQEHAQHQNKIYEAARQAMHDAGYVANLLTEKVDGAA